MKASKGQDKCEVSNQMLNWLIGRKERSLKNQRADRYRE